MSPWGTAPLEELVSVVGGGTPTRSTSDYYGGSIPWVTPKDMKSWEIRGAQVSITQTGLESSATRLIPAHSVLVVVRSGVLKHTLPVALTRLPVAINQDMKALLCGDRMDAGFLARFISSQSPTILKWVRATTADNFPVDKLKRLGVPVPPLPEQRRIAEVLDRVEALRAKRRAALAQLDTLTQSIFLDMFGDPANNPKSWPQKPLGELIADGPQNGLYKPAADYGSGTPIVRIDAFYDGAITKLASLKRVRVSTEERALYALHPGDILVNRVNSREFVGKSALVPMLAEPTVFESNMMRFAVDRAVVDPGFLIEYLQTRFVRTHIVKCTKDAVNQSSINQQDVKSIPTVLPPRPLQERFVGRLAGVERLKSANTASLASLAALFASLQYRAFRGEL